MIININTADMHPDDYNTILSVINVQSTYVSRTDPRFTNIVVKTKDHPITLLYKLANATNPILECNIMIKDETNNTELHAIFNHLGDVQVKFAIIREANITLMQ